MICIRLRSNELEAKHMDYGSSFIMIREKLNQRTFAFPKKSFLRHTEQRCTKKNKNGATITMYFHVSLILLFVFLNSSFLLVLSLFPLLVCNKTFFKLSFCFSYFSPFYDANCSFFHFTVLVFAYHG